MIDRGGKRRKGKEAKQTQQYSSSHQELITDTSVSNKKYSYERLFKFSISAWPVQLSVAELRPMHQEVTSLTADQCMFLDFRLDSQQGGCRRQPICEKPHPMWLRVQDLEKGCMQIMRLDKKYEFGNRGQAESLSEEERRCWCPGPANLPFNSRYTYCPQSGRQFQQQTDYLKGQYILVKIYFETDWSGN